MSTGRSTHTALIKIHKVLVESLDVYIPETTCSVNYKRIKREPWLTSGIKTRTGKVKLLYKQMQRKGCDDHCHDKYKTYNQMLTKVGRNAKRYCYLRVCENFKNNTKKFWQTINEVSGKFSHKSGIIDHITVDAIDYYQPKQIANEFGNYF